MARIGVFVCHCGINIADTVDVEKVAIELGKVNGVTASTTYQYMCSDPGQKLIRDTIVEKDLDGVVVASCSPRLHERTFQLCVEAAGLNRYRFEMANIREQCSWVHRDKKKGYPKGDRSDQNGSGQTDKERTPCSFFSSGREKGPGNRRGDCGDSGGDRYSQLRLHGYHCGKISYYRREDGAVGQDLSHP